MSANSLPFVLAVLERFNAARLPIWLFGGWAEELWSISAPRAHHDIDLLYIANTFDTLDQYIDQTSTLTEIRAKRFSHKRAVLHQGVMIEFMLVEPHIERYRTRFFTNLYELAWPRDLLDYQLAIHTRVVPVASKAALEVYRYNHSHIEAAYQTYSLSC
jgi:aminoglycoside-2''-adenylyltransferase